MFYEKASFSTPQVYTCNYNIRFSFNLHKYFHQVVKVSSIISEFLSMIKSSVKPPRQPTIFTKAFLHFQQNTFKISTLSCMSDNSNFSASFYLVFQLSCQVFCVLGFHLPSCQLCSNTYASFSAGMGLFSSECLVWCCLLPCPVCTMASKTELAQRCNHLTLHI